MKSKKRAWEIGSGIALFLIVLVCGSIGAWWLDRPRRATEQLTQELNRIYDETLNAGLDVSLKESQRLQELVRQGARLDVKTESGITLLEAVASAGDRLFIEQLVARGVDLNARGSGSGALGAAARAGHAVVVELLLAKGARVRTGTAGITPLMIATMSGNPRIISTLVAAGARVNDQDYLGRTALNWSVGYGHPEAVKTLLDLGADPSLGDRTHKTPLQNAIKARDSRKKRGLSPTLQARWDQTVVLLQRAARQRAPSPSRVP